MNSDPERPISSVMGAMMHRIANGDTDMLAQLQHYVLDPEDTVADRWQYLRLAERDAWKAVELLLLRKMLERRFSEGELDAWVDMTPFGDDIRQGLESFFEYHRSVEFPVDPKGFGPLAFQELRAARLAGELYAEACDSAPSNAKEIIEQLAERLEGRFPLFAQSIRHPKLDIASMTWCFLAFRLRLNIEMTVALPTSQTPPSNVGMEDLAVLFVNWPTTIEELIGDVYVEAWSQPSFGH